jgi:hypothetical protein
VIPLQPCRWCGEPVSSYTEVAHPSCVREFLRRLEESGQERSGRPERVGDYVDRLAGGER